jgi:hypothetical protein
MTETRKPYEAPRLVLRDKIALVSATLIISGFAKQQDSDLRLKEDIRPIGVTAHGLPYYSFRYRGKPEIYEGVMAQDVLGVMPDAVVLGSDGYLRVNYEKLGVTFRRLN